MNRQDPASPKGYAAASAKDAKKNKGKSIRVRCYHCGGRLSADPADTSALCRRCQQAYPTMAQRFDAALDAVRAQVLSGKGAARHGRGRSLDAQPIWRLLDLCGPGGAAFQAMKKVEEALGLMQVGAGGAYEIVAADREKAIESELLGAIAYLAFLVAWRRQGQRPCTPSAKQQEPGAMTFAEASAVVVPFGKFKGLALDKIAESDQGLLWLDWLRGVGARTPRLSEALAVYLADKAIASDLERLERK